MCSPKNCVLRLAYGNFSAAAVVRNNRKDKKPSLRQFPVINRIYTAGFFTICKKRAILDSENRALPRKGRYHDCLLHLVLQTSL